ncbi:MAG: SHOCT domain-containing protein [Pyrinomonadaceae bacterium]
MIYSLPQLLALALPGHHPSGMAALIYLQSSSSDSSGFACCFIFIIIIVIAVAMSVSSSKRQAEMQAAKQAERSKAVAEQARAQVRALSQARESYLESLSMLKDNPASADLRQRTLELGRSYSNLTRSEKGVTVFDELALMNDINAASGGAQSASLPSPAVAEKPSIEERLTRLAELKVQGLIDEQEYSSRRQKILDEI